MLVMIEQKFQSLARSFTIRIITYIMARVRENHVIPPIFCLLVITIIYLIDHANCKPYQLLKHKDGYIAVFIRHGDEPLANIDPVLAEAFDEKNVENDVLPLEHQNIDSIKKTLINNKKSSNLILSELNIKNEEPQAHLTL